MASFHCDPGNLLLLASLFVLREGGTQEDLPGGGTDFQSGSSGLEHSIILSQITDNSDSGNCYCHKQ